MLDHRLVAELVCCGSFEMTAREGNFFSMKLELFSRMSRVWTDRDWVLNEYKQDEAGLFINSF